MTSRQPEGAAGVEALIEEVVRELRAAGGANLLGVALYGSLVKGRYTPGLSDVNVLVVVADGGLPALLPLAPVLTGAYRRAQVSAFVATPEDLRAAARLFPARILDMQLFHRRLHGDLHLAEISVDAGQLQYRTVQELRNLQLRLRRQALERGAEPAVLWELLVRSLPKLAVALGTLLRGRGAQLPLERAPLLLQAARELGLAEEAMVPFAGLRRRDARPEDAAVCTLAGQYLDLLGTLATAAGGGQDRNQAGPPA
jgi:predicted nucleotidyltransferase